MQNDQSLSLPQITNWIQPRHITLGVFTASGQPTFLCWGHNLTTKHPKTHNLYIFQHQTTNLINASRPFIGNWPWESSQLTSHKACFLTSYAT